MYTRLAWLPVLALPLMGADPKWIRMPSGSFEIYSSAGESDSRRVLQYFERAREFFAQTGKPPAAKSEPIRVIVFGSKKEYEPYRPNEFAAAFYMGGAARDYIVLGGTDADVFPIAVHEYVHLILQNAGVRLPPWLNEGFAELYSTLKPIGDKVVVGNLVPGRIQALRREKWTPLAAILSADHNSPYYNEKSKAGNLYNQGWALTHMLALTSAYAPQFAKLVGSIDGGKPSQQALEETYGKSLTQIENELQGYIRGDQFQAGVLKAKLSGPSGKAASEILPSFDLKLALLDLTNRRGREAESRTAFEALAAEDPRRPEPQIGLAYLAWRLRDQDKAAEHFGKAFDLGARNPVFLFDYGRGGAEADPVKAARALQVLLADQPDRRDVRLRLAEVQLMAKDAKASRATLASIRTVKPDEAVRYFRILTYASMETADFQEAQSAARRWKEQLKDEADQEQVNRILDYLVARAAAPPPTFRAEEAEAFETAAGRGNSPSSTSRALASFTGNLVEMQCSGGESRLLVEGAAGMATFLMTNPDAVTARGVVGRKVVDLTCGKLKPVEVIVRYEPAPDQTAAGIVRTIDFRALPESLPGSPQTAVEAIAPKVPARPYVAGSFVELDCSSLPPRMIILAGKERIPFLMDSVDNMFVYGLPDGKGMEMTCGPQKPAPNLWVEYDTPSASQRGVRGLTRAIHFEPVPGTALKTR